MKIGIYYFSGSGNTKWVGEEMMGLLMKQGHQVEISSIEDKPQVGHEDLIIIGGPIYAGNMPEMLLKWVLKEVPKTNGGKAIVYSTSACLENAFGVFSLAKKLEKKGYKIGKLLPYILPRNYYISNYEPTPKAEAIQLFEEAKVAIDRDMMSFDGSYDRSQKVIFWDIFAKIMLMMSKVMGRKLAASPHCTLCKKCERNCPTGNIRVNQEVVFAGKCMLCTRCIHSCPVNAITYKGKSIEQYDIKSLV